MATVSANGIGVSEDSGRARIRYALAGVEAGVLGAMVMFVCLAIGSLFNGRSIWTAPNLFATTFFGGAAYRNHLVRTSWTGLAFILALYGLLGALWGIAWKEKRRGWLAIAGAVAGIAVYYLLFDLLWQRLNPLIPAYAPDRPLLIGHILWGLILARSPLFARRIAQRTSDFAPVAHVSRPEFQDAAAEEVRSEEVRSGDSIR